MYLPLLGTESTMQEKSWALVEGPRRSTRETVPLVVGYDLFRHRRSEGDRTEVRTLQVISYGLPTGT